MRNFAAAALAMTVFASNAFAADNAPLSPGRPAGVHQAQLAGNGLLLIAGIAVVAGGIALVASNGGGHIANTTTTVTSTSTTSP